MDVRQIDLAEWGDALPSSGFEPFHLPDALQVVEQHTGGNLVLYGGFNGDRPVGLFPAFVHDRSLSRTVTSPPPSLGIPRLGPILMPASPKQRKQEQVNRRFADAVLEALDVGSRRTLFRSLLSTEAADPRPYGWAGLEIEPQFTYHLDVADASADDLLSGFSRDLRKDIRKGQDLGITVDIEGLDSAREIHESVDRRYREQGKTFSLSWPFVRDVVRSLGDRARVIVARTPDGAFRNGMIFLYSNDAVYSWMGGIRDTYESVSTKSMVQWGMLTELVESPPIESVTRYDLSGANTKRLCEYKSAFGGTLVPYYTIETTGASMELAKKAYRLVKG